MSEQPAALPDEPSRPVFAGWGRWPRRVVENCLVTLVQGLPLFRREMLVQSSRIRTYAVRSAFAVILFFVALVYAAVATGTPLIGAAVRLPGQGMVILHALVWMLFAFVYVFAPATASGVITLEKERQTLILLYLTKLTPWHIILEKFLSRLLPLLGILLLALPLLVFAYTFGGVSQEMLGTAVWFLVVTAVQVTAVAVLCSTVCRHTTQAFVLTYFVLVLLYWGPALGRIWLLDRQFNNANIWAAFDVSRNTPDPALAGYPGMPVTGTVTVPNALPAIPRQLTLFALLPPLLFAFHYQPAIAGGAFQWEPMLLAGVPSLLSAFCCLVLARLLLFHRAFEEHRFSPLRRLKSLGRRMWLGHHSTVPASSDKPIVLRDIPHNQPITWRESSRGTRNWLPFLLLLEVPTLVLVLWLARTAGGDSLSISAEICVLWAVATLLICIHSSSLINRERNQQTLELLLATPLSSAEIIRQKFNGTRRLMLICAVPLLSCIAFQAWWRSIVYVPQPPSRLGFYWWEYLITASMCVFIYFQLIAWIALWAGLRNKSPTRAMLEALGGVLCLCCVPQVILALPLLALIPPQLFGGFRFLLLLAAQVSPVVMIALAEFTNLRDICNVPLLPTIANTVIYGGILLWARRYVLDRADVLLGRTVHY